jgi:hypothetical protein
VRCTGGYGLIRGIRLRERSGGVMAEECMNLPVHALDLIKARLRDGARRNFAFRQVCREFGNRELVEHPRAGKLANVAAKGKVNLVRADSKIWW